MRLALVALASLAIAAPAFAEMHGAISCARAAAADEKAICATTELVQLDAQMSVEYDLLKGFLAMGGRGALMDEQRDWLKARAACKADAKCLRKAYTDRIAVLEKGLERVKEHGPF